jgi:hypothetical protein
MPVLPDFVAVTEDFAFIDAELGTTARNWWTLRRGEHSRRHGRRPPSARRQRLWVGN